MKLVATLLMSGVLAFSGCTLPQMVKKSKEQKLTTTPDPLEVHADKVDFEMTGILPVKMMKKGTTYTGKVEYVYAGKRADVGTLEFKGDDYPNYKKEEPKKTQTFSFPYAEGMDQRGNLVMTGTAANKKGKTKPTPEFPFTRGLITTSRLTKDIYLVSYAPHGYNNQPEFEPVSVNFYFLQGSPALRPSETGSKRGKFLDAFIAEKNVTKTVTVVGTHSPEGSDAKNTKLSGQRAETVESHYKAQMKRFDYKTKADSIEFVTKATIQDWGMFKDTLNADKELTEEQKGQAVAIADGSDSFFDKAAQLAKLPFYRRIVTNVYPKLRNAQTEILKLKDKKPDPEIAVLGKQIAEGKESADKLNDQELLYAANLTPLLEEKKAIYEASMKKSDSWQAHNNFGAVHLDYAKKEMDKTKMTALVDAAITHFQMANNKMESGEAYANLAVAYTMKGMSKEAEEALTKASGMNSNQDVARAVKATQGVMQIKKGQYTEAINSLGAAGQDAMVLYNKGLAQVLAKQNDAAMATLNESVTADASAANAWSYYVMAIAAARSKNESALTANLQKAVTLDSTLKAKALQDLEFDAYANGEGFKNAVK
ncbi:MAG: hypothetical protein H7Y04_10770 [Verrucomicrobia bacterium]|nr:hypothetical protein [Cytophagales bacterium]